MAYELLIQPAAWAALGTIAITATVVGVRRHRKGLSPRTPLTITAAAVTLAVLVVPAVAFVPAGQRGVIYRWGGGISQNERGEGLAVLTPWVQNLRLVNVRTQKVFSAKVFAQSADLQEITVVASVNYHIDPPRAAELYQKVGPQYRETVIQPALYQLAKAAVGQIKAEDFALQRTGLAKTIQAELTIQLAPYGIIVEWVNIEDAIFDPAFVKAVKTKIIAEQEALTQRNLIEAKRALKTQTIIDAEAKARAIQIEATAQAEANRRINRSLSGPILRWKWLTTWNGTLPSTLVGGGDNLTLLLGAGGGTGAVYGY